MSTYFPASTGSSERGRREFYANAKPFPEFQDGKVNFLSSDGSSAKGAMYRMKDTRRQATPPETRLSLRVAGLRG